MTKRRLADDLAELLSPQTRQTGSGGGPWRSRHKENYHRHSLYYVEIDPDGIGFEDAAAIPDEDEELTNLMCVCAQ